MNFIDSLILGIVEGITEFLPISSTGHLILTGEVLGLVSTEFLKSFDIVVQMGAIAAVVFLYWRSFLKISVWQKVLAAFIPTGLIGFALYRIIKSYLIGNPAVVLWALLAGGLALIVFEKLHRESPEAADSVEKISFGQALGIGVCQALAVVPGVSRAAATIVGGLAFGLKRPAIVEFSFLLAVPTMLAASGYDLLQSAGSFAAVDFKLIAVGFLVSFFTALAAIKWLLGFIRHHNFIGFGFYRILAAAAFWLILF